MKSFVVFSFLVTVACLVKAIDLGDIYMFLPSLKNYEPPPTCPPNELYKTCMSQCSDCDQRGMCVITSCNSGCDCAPRFFRVTPNGPCEPVANCPRPECGENEVFRECGPICERCTTIKCRVINCDHKCYCKEGYLRDRDGICIPAEECPEKQRCSRDEEWAESGPVDEYCLHAETDTMNNDTQNVAKCYCKEGYSRNTLGHCISVNLCPLIRCLEVEIYYKCIPKCNTTCRNYGDPSCTEDDNCYPGCFCPPGYVMNDLRTCTPVEECSLDIKQVKIMETSVTAKVDEESSNSDNSTESTDDEITDTTDSTEYPYSYETSEDGHSDSDQMPSITDVSPDQMPSITDVSPDQMPSVTDVSTDQMPSITEVSPDQIDIETTRSPISPSSVNVKDPKGKDYLKTKASKEESSKHANAATASEISKGENPKDEEEI